MPDRLYFTDSDEANALIATDPMALLVGFALDQQITVQHAFAGPLTLRERLGSIDAARRTGARRYLIVSSIGADNPSAAGEQMRPYLDAKAEADRRLADSGLDWTIVRPGRLTDAPGTGRVTVTTDMSVRGDVPRQDVARVLAASLGDPSTIGKTFVVVGGETPVDEALATL